MRRPSWIVIAFLAWTAFVWAGRIRNGGSVLLAVSFLALAAVALWQRGRWITALVVWTIAVWAIRTPQILVADHPVAFKIVHTVLALVSIALAALVQRDVQREREAAATPARL
ncbi:MAG: hypothetical protein QOD92_2650 [Acidimicrobiaceae bacterium]|jgi:hypothetical protein